MGTASFNSLYKGAIAHATVHRAVWEYLAALSKIENEAEAEKLGRELFGMMVASFHDVPAPR